VATFTSHSVEETIAFAREWARGLQPNEVIAARGDLGSGKTQFVKGLVAGCGSGDAVTSPTFTLLHEYRGGRIPVFHFDFYRLEHRSEVERLGVDDYLDAGGITVVEWADRFPEIFPERTRWLDFTNVSETARTIIEQEK
jgi:tRNA threonylcarbamoyladenosine biosynthesis protein TsaE